MKLITDRGDAKDLDLSYSDISGIKLGSSTTPMPALDKVIFGQYGWILSGVNAEHTLFHRTSLKGAKFIYANLVRSNFYKSDLTCADLRFANLTDANFSEANLASANLFGARLQDTNLRDTNLHLADLYHVHLSGKTNLRRSNLRGYILQENEVAYKHFVEKMILPDSLNGVDHHLEDRISKAESIYEKLMLHFDENGYSDDSTWAYLRKCRMRKKWKFILAKRSFKQKKLGAVFKYLFSWWSDWLVELLCDYGESIWRVLFWMAVCLLLVGPITIYLAGGLLWNEASYTRYKAFSEYVYQLGYIYLQYVLYTTDTFTTASFAEVLPATDLVRIMSGIMAMTGIFLTGLLGFVAGNKIRR